jgi:hypothetical protein
LESLRHLEEEHAEKEVQVRLHAELDLSQSHVDLDVQTQGLKAASNQKEWDICIARDKELEEIRSEMAQRRQAIRARFETVIRDQPPGLSKQANITRLVETVDSIAEGTNNTTTVVANTPLPLIPTELSSLVTQPPLTTSDEKSGTSNTQLLVASNPLLAPAAKILSPQDCSSVTSKAQSGHLFPAISSSPNDGHFQLVPSYDPLDHDGSSTTGISSTHMCCGCCGQHRLDWCIHCLGNHC